MLLNGSWRVGITPEEIERLGAEGRQIATRQGDARSRLDIEESLVPAYWLSGQLAKAAEICEEAIRLADAVDDMTLRSIVRGNLGHISVCSGRLDAALRLFEQALEIAGDDPQVGLERIGLPYRSGRSRAAAGRKSRWGG
jgi:tetratricopeptide (TPR) repeat protein